MCWVSAGHLHRSLPGLSSLLPKAQGRKRTPGHHIPSGLNIPLAGQGIDIKHRDEHVSMLVHCYDRSQGRQSASGLGVDKVRAWDLSFWERVSYMILRGREYQAGGPARAKSLRWEGAGILGGQRQGRDPRGWGDIRMEGQDGESSRRLWQGCPGENPHGHSWMETPLSSALAAYARDF